MSAAPEFGTRFLLGSHQSDGEVAVMENSAPGRWQGPPLHRHDFDEAFYVLEGELTFQIGEDVSTAGPGELVFAPRGSVHTLANRSEEPSRYLLVCTPGGFERTLARRWAERDGADPPAWAAGEMPVVEVVGPPIEL
ncbi:MAG: cupin domain-containing protein [Actinobacteria bacterium]|nr:cupin domain-containing protein [Actinomycetota bacterium]